MNYFSFYNIARETVGEIFNHLEMRELPKLNGVYKEWKQLLDASHFNFYSRAYYKIWKELPIGQFQNMRQIFSYRFQYIKSKDILPTANSRKMLTINDIQNIADYIWTFRKKFFDQKKLDGSSNLWLGKFHQAYKDNNSLEKHYAARELQLLLEASGEPNSLTDLGVKLLTKITNWDGITDEADQKYKIKKAYWDIIQHLFLDRSKFKQLVVSYSELEQANPFLLYTAIRCGFHAILDVFLETNSQQLIDDAPNHMIDAASYKQFDMLNKMLDHSPPLACSSIQSQNQNTALHFLCSLNEDEVEHQQWQACVKKLVDRGCSLFQRNVDQYTPFHQTIECRNLNFLKFILKISDPLSAEICQDLINYTNEMEIIEGEKEQACQLHSTILALLLKTQVVLIEKGEEYTLFHQALEHRNKDLFGFLLRHSPFISKLSLQNLKDYFIDSIEEEGPLDVMTQDKEYTSEIQILKLLLNAHPSLIDAFNFTFSIYDYPWKLAAFIAHETENKQVHLQKLLSAVLEIPFHFIQKLLLNSLDDDSDSLDEENSVDLHQNIGSSMQLLHQQFQQILSAGLDLKLMNQQHFSNLLLLSLKSVKETIEAEVQDKELANSLFSICQTSYLVLDNKFKSLLTEDTDRPSLKRRRLEY